MLCKAKGTLEKGVFEKRFRLIVLDEGSNRFPALKNKLLFLFHSSGKKKETGNGTN